MTAFLSVLRISIKNSKIHFIMKKFAILTFGLLFFAFGLHAQMYVDSDTLYGNEWINYDQSHRKAYVTADGVYRIPYQTLASSGVPGSVSAQNLQLFVNGEELPIYTSTNGTMGSGDYIEFYTQKNKGDMDKHMYVSQDQLFNPYYSMYTDSSAVFLTWNNSTNNRRFTNTANDLNSLPAPEASFLHEVVKIDNPKYNKGVENGEQYESTFSPGEGFGNSFISDKTYNMTLNNLVSGGSGARLEMNFAAVDDVQHSVNLSINGSNLSVDDANFSNYRLFNIDQNIPTSLLAVTTDVRLLGQVGSSDKYSIAFVKIEYPRSFDFEGKSTFKFNMPTSGSKQYLEITNFNYGSQPPILYDLTNDLRILTNVTNNTVRIALPASSTDRELVLVSQSAATNLEGMISVNFTNYFDTQGDFVMLCHNKFMQGENYAQQYADYRATTGYEPVLIDIAELYDQFAYGISKHSMSVRNFTGFSLENWTTQPKYVFMIGKARPYYSVRTNWNAQPAYTPTFGHDPSDNLLTATTTSDVPRIAIGRIPITSVDELRIYLKKVQAFENNVNLPQTIEDKAWMKRIIHLGGGDVSIQTAIKNNLKQYEDVIEEDFFGGEVSSFFKNSSDPIQISTSGLLDSLINDGSSMLTFYGHSSPNSFDFNLDSPENYENLNRYPLILSLGCYSGQIHQKAKNLGERFVFVEDGGAIAFLATVSLSGLPALDVFAERFYRKLAVENYGQGIGDVIKSVTQELEDQGVGISNRIVYHQMTLNGDPSIRLNSAPAPDFIVKRSSIAFDPATPDANDGFDLTFTVTNIGKATPDQFRLLIERILPNGVEVTVVDEMVDSPEFEREYNYTMQAQNGSIGLNQFRITVDAGENIAELPDPAAEDNNTEIADLFIFSDDVEPVYPYDFSILGSADDFVLKAYTANPFAAEHTYQLEIDTTELFNSPMLKSTEVTQPGGLIEWTPNIALTNETVYYWRVQVDPSEVPDALGWRGRSFVYLNGENPGWNQSHYFQFLKDRFNNLKYPNRHFEFVNDNIEVVVNNAHVGVLNTNEIDFSVNGSRLYDIENCEKNEQGMYIVLFDENLTPIVNTQSGTNQGQYSSFLCRPTALAFLYPTDTPQGRLNLQNFLTGIVTALPEVRYMLAYSLNDYMPETWTPGLSGAFAARGLMQVPTTQGAPYAGMVDLEAGITIGEVVGANEGAIIEAVLTVEGSWTEGVLASTIVGPATDWGSMHWDTSEEEANDEVVVRVYGITPQNERVVLFNTVTERDFIFEGGNSIDAAAYPRLQLEFDIADPVNATATQLEHWRVIYDELPDVALRPDLVFTFESDTIRRGENLRMKIAVQNISGSDLDSLLMSYTIVSNSTNVFSATDRLRPLAASDTLVAFLEVETKTFSGNNQLIIEANPNDDQAEATRVNNVAIKSFFVDGDKLNPILDVTFDGQHIIDGDIVSANPNIVISLRDENEYLELADTSLFKILMKYPGESALRQISFDSDLITFYPAERGSSENKAIIELRPNLELDGVYQLFVQAEDVSGNQSGDLDFKASFEVVRRKGVTNVLNYPNPFTSSTRFVFTLTGSTVPDYMKIQIMTVTGKIVREITTEELGDLHIGNNITDFAWDGTDEFGDKLANGVYLYRVVTKDSNGQEYERFNNNTNQYFKNGFGKMYLMR